jgi:hypothetical protein
LAATLVYLIGKILRSQTTGQDVISKDRNEFFVVFGLKS